MAAVERTKLVGRYGRSMDKKIKWIEEKLNVARLAEKVIVDKGSSGEDTTDGRMWKTNRQKTKWIVEEAGQRNSREVTETERRVNGLKPRSPPPPPQAHCPHLSRKPCTGHCSWLKRKQNERKRGQPWWEWDGYTSKKEQQTRSEPLRVRSTNLGVCLPQDVLQTANQEASLVLHVLIWALQADNQLDCTSPNVPSAVCMVKCQHMINVYAYNWIMNRWYVSKVDKTQIFQQHFLRCWNFQRNQMQ